MHTKLFAVIAEIVAYLVKGLFILIGRLRLKAIRNGIKIEIDEISAVLGGDPYPFLEMKMRFDITTDGRVNVQNMLFRLNCSNWEICRPILNVEDDLPKTLGCRTPKKKTVRIYPPLYFWMASLNQITINGEMYVSSIWGSTSIKMKECKDMKVGNFDIVVQEFLSQMRQKLGL